MRFRLLLRLALLPPLFLASPEFALNFKTVLEQSIFPALWETRRMS